LSTHKGLEGKEGYSWGEKTKILEYSFKKSMKSLISGKDQSRDYKQIWNSLQRYINMFLPSNGYIDIEYTL